MQLLKKALFLVISLLLPLSVFADWHQLPGNSTKPDQPFSVELLQSKLTETIVRVKFAGFESKTFQINGKQYISVTVPGLNTTDEKGYPALPKLNKNIAIPTNVANASVTVVDVEYEDFNLGKVAPSKGAIFRNQNPDEVPYSFEAIYNENRFYPTEVAAVGKPFQMRDVRGVNLALRPFRFNPRTGILRVAKELVLKVKAETLGRSAFITRPGQAIDAGFNQLYKNVFINYNANLQSLDVNHIVEDTGRILIVYNPLFTSALGKFVEWKQQRGFKVQLASTVQTGSTYMDIKKFIQQKYTDDRISYVILVGDAEFVAFHPGTAGNAKGNEADPLYGVLEGNDVYPEVMISRFSAKNLAGLETIINKIVSYERDPDLNGDWYSKATGIASAEGDPTDFERAEVLREMLEKWNYRQIDKLYDPGVLASEVGRAINEGRGFINYIGHGSKTSWGTSRFSVSDINQLQNGRMLPFIVSVACINGDFSGAGESFAERWLLAGSPEKQSGAVAIFASSTNQSWVPPTVGQLEISRLLTSEQMNSIGTLFVHGSIAVLEDGSSSADQTFQTWHIFGDATMQVRTKAPSEIQAKLPDVIDADGGKFDIDLTAPGLVVSVTQNSKFLGSAKSGVNGMANVELDLRDISDSVALITVTGPDRIPLVKETKLKL